MNIKIPENFFKNKKRKRSEDKNDKNEDKNNKDKHRHNHDINISNNDKHHNMMALGTNGRNSYLFMKLNKHVTKK